MKQYLGEKAIISLTSWKARIKTVGLTIYSLLTQCPGFHIVLVLSEEEFPKKEAELPEDLVLMSRCGKIEILWVYRNFKSLKKILFTMEKFPDVPVISSDDDIIHTFNYADILYQMHLKHPNTLITFNNRKPKHTSGAFTLYYPRCFGTFDVMSELSNNKHLDKYMVADDAFYEMLRAKYHDSPVIQINNTYRFMFAEENSPLHSIYTRPGFLADIRRIQSEDAGKSIFSILGE